MSQLRSSRARFRDFLEKYRRGQLDDETDARKGATSALPDAKAKPKKLLGGKRREYARDYLRWLKPHRGGIAMVFAFALAAAGLQMIEPLFMRFIVDRVLLKTGLDASSKLAQLQVAGATFLVVILL